MSKNALSCSSLKGPCFVLIMAVLGLALLGAPVRAQSMINLDRELVLPPTALFSAAAANAQANRSARIRLFRFAPGFFSDPYGLEPDELTPADLEAAVQGNADGPDWIQVAMGNDNPFFDLRKRGDPGGLGYYKVHTQVQVLDNGRTGCAVDLQAVTPNSIQMLNSNSLLSANTGDGPTIVSPAFALFHALDDGTAVQGFVGQKVHLRSGWASRLQKNLQCGMALQRPLAPDGPDGLRNVFVYVGALGEVRADEVATGAPTVWEVLPGLHWKVSDNWWMSGGLILPMGPARGEGGLWQLTCSFQF